MRVAAFSAGRLAHAAACRRALTGQLCRLHPGDEMLDAWASRWSAAVGKARTERRTGTDEHSFSSPRHTTGSACQMGRFSPVPVCRCH
eukprot:scaffold6516_cov126-Isochrysis_galbana.AAC.3